jgi:hypothetical protein
MLVDLPDPCLLAVLQLCVDELWCEDDLFRQDLSSVFNAASAHSRLHQAATAALSSIFLATNDQHREVANPQLRVDQLLVYLSKHGQHIFSVKLECEA